MLDKDPARPTLEQLAEEFAERHRNGECPDLNGYAERYPEFAAQILDLFPAMVMMEDIAPDSEDSTGSSLNPQSSADQQLPARIGDFRIIREAGRGGMGIVYEAEQVSLGRHVALKVLPELASAKQKRRFEREAKAAAKLHHTNIVPVFGVGEEDGLSYYVMQFIQGLGLDEVLDELKHLQTGVSAATTPGELKVSRVSRLSEPRVVTDPEGKSDYTAADVARTLVAGHVGQLAYAEEGADGDSGVAALRQDGSHGPMAGKVDRPQLPPAASTNGFGSSGSSSGAFSLSQSSGSQSGGTLSSVDRRKPRTYFQSVAHIGQQVAEALSYAHDQGIVHRDIKPGNILLDLRGTAWVTDFGLAKATDQQDITHTGDIVGTLRYMPPEAFEANTGALGDIYSLGLTLYELLALRPAFSNSERQRLIKRITTGEPDRLDGVKPDVPRDLVTIVHKAIERTPKHRYQSADELTEDLHRFLNDEPIKARRITFLERFLRWSRRNRGLAASLAVVAALLLVMAGGSLLAARHFQDLATTNGLLVQEKQQALEKESEALRAAVLAQQDATAQRELTRRNLYASSLFAAQQSLVNSQGTLRVRGLLAELKPRKGETDLRGWEWFYLNAVAHRNESLIIPVDNPQISAAFDPSGERVFSIFGGLTAFDARTGNKLFHVPVGWHRSFDFSHDGKLVWIGGKIWDTQEWSDQSTDADAGWVKQAAWSADDSRIATAGNDGTIKIWNSISGELVQTLRGHTNSVNGVGWSDDGTQIISASSDKSVRIWDVNTGELTRIVCQQDHGINAMSLHSNDEQVAVGVGPNVKVIQLETGEVSRLFPMGVQVGWLDWSPDGRHLAASEFRGTEVRIWHVETGVIVDSISSPSGGFQGCGWSPDGTRLVTPGGKDIRIWKTNIVKPFGQVDARIGSSQDSYHRMSVHPNGDWIATLNGAERNEVSVWDVDAQRKLHNLAKHTSRINDLAWNPSGSELALASDDGSIGIWTPGSDDPSLLGSAHGESPVHSLAWHSNGSRLASGGEDRAVRIWDVSSGTALRSFVTPVSPSCLAWHPIEPMIAAAAFDSVCIWDTGSGDLIATLSNPGLEIRSLTFHPQGNLLVVAGRGSDAISISENSLNSLATIRLWDLGTRNELRTFRGHQKQVNSVRWDSSAARIISASDDGTVRIWNVDTGQELLSLNDTDKSPISSACFSPGELKVAALSQRGVMCWDATSAFEMEHSPRLLPVLSARIKADQRSEDLLLRARILAQDGSWGEAAKDFEQAASIQSPSADQTTWFSTHWVAFPVPLDQQDRLPEYIERFLVNPHSNDEGRWEAFELARGLYFDFAYHLELTQQVSGVVTTRVFSMCDQTVGCLLGATGHIRLYCNGELVGQREQPRPVIKDGEAFDLPLKSGWNTVAVQTTADERQHGLFVRLTDDHQELARRFEQMENWSSALEHWTAVVEQNDRETSDIDLKRGKAALRANRVRLAEEAFAAHLEHATDKFKARREIAKAYADHGREVALHDQANSDRKARMERARSSLATARKLCEQLLDGETLSDEALREQYHSVADTLAETVYYHFESSSWITLEPNEAISAGGARLRKMYDHSILADGTNPEQDRYTITSEVSAEEIVAIRLAPMRDRSMTNGSTGRCLTGGDYKLAEFELAVDDPDGNKQRIDFTMAYRGYRSVNGYYDMTPAIDGDSTTDCAGSDPSDIIFVPKEPIRPGRHRLTFVMRFGEGRHALGRFRLAVTSDPQVIQHYANRHKIIQHDDAMTRLGISYALVGETEAAALSFARALDAAKDDEVTEIVASAKEFEGVFDELKRIRPDHIARGIGKPEV